MDKHRATANRMGLLALTMMAASNMMGSGVFMLPAPLTRIGTISLSGWGLTLFGVTMLAIIFSKTSDIFPQNGGIIANISPCFGPIIGLQMTLFYWLSIWFGNYALLQMAPIPLYFLYLARRQKRALCANPLRLPAPIFSAHKESL